VKYLVGFLKHPAAFKIVYTRGRNFDGIFRIVVMADSDLGGDREDGRSTMGIVAYVNESLCYGASKTIKAVVLNNTHGEYYSLTEGPQLGIWFPVPVLGDYEATEQTASVPETKCAHNTNLREHWIRSVMRFGDLTSAHIPPAWNAADIYTKALATADFDKLVELLLIDKCTHNANYQSNILDALRGEPGRTSVIW
jgi:hypothetical protein